MAENASTRWRSGNTLASVLSHWGAPWTEANTPEMKASGSSVMFATTGAVSAFATNDETASPSAQRQRPPMTIVTTAAGSSRGYRWTPNSATPSTTRIRTEAIPERSPTATSEAR